ncbi:MAG: hypothetical protein HRT90_03920 [Candidatus Margulisbacteria bacterium]|nr:hypothetical protein [Candidatus Margulisiibacteriota bacterium]
MKKTILTSLILLLISSPGFALTETFLIQSIGTSAKMIGIGNIEGFDSSSASVFENPASLYAVKTLSASVFSTTFLDDAGYFNASIGWNTGYGNVAIGFMQASVNGIPDTGIDPFGEVTQIGAFNFEDSVAKLAYQYSLLDHIHLGVGASYFSKSLKQLQGNGFGMDVGIFGTFDAFEISASIKNILNQNISYTDGGEDEFIPIQILLGGRYKLNQIDVYGQLKLTEKNNRLTSSVGLTYRPIDIFYLSAGYKEFTVLNEIRNNIVLGLGLELGLLNVYFAYEDSEVFKQDSQYYFSISINNL